MKIKLKSLSALVPLLWCRKKSDEGPPNANLTAGPIMLEIGS